MRYAIAVWLCLAGNVLAANTGYLKLDDDAAGTTVVATVGTDCSIVGVTNTSDVQTDSGPGPLAYAFDLAGDNDAVVIGGIADVAFANLEAFTASVWVNLDSVTAQPVFGRNIAGQQIVVTDATTITVNGGSGDTAFTVPTMSTGTWYHIFVTRDTSNSVRVFVNGTESSTGAQTNLGAYAFSYMGRSASTYLDGRVSQFRIFDSDESANVATYYAEGVDSGSAVPIIVQQLHKR